MTIGLRCLVQYSATLALVGGLSSHAVAQVESTAPGQRGSVEVTNSPGANTNVTYHIYEEARRDRRTQQLVATLRNYNRFVGEFSQLWQIAPVYLFALDDSANRAASNEVAPFYFILVANLDAEEFGERAAQCEVQSGIKAVGFLAAASVEASTARTRVRLMTPEDASILNQICQGLGRSASTLVGSGGSASEATVFDYLSRETNVVAIALFPERLMGQSLETGMIRDYWTSALLSRYIRLPTLDSRAQLAIFNQLDAFMSGRWVNVPIRLPFTFPNPSSYPRQARAEFGSRIDRLDADWRAYLSGAAMTLRHERQPLTVNSQWTRLVPRFTMSQVGSREFWLGADDLRLFYEQLDCIAKDFLVDRGYVAPDEYSVPGRCALEEIRLPAS